MSQLSKEDIGKLIKIITKKENKEITFLGYLVAIKDNFYKIKLKDNGYNVDVIVDENTKIEISEIKVNLGKLSTNKLNYNSKLPNIVYIGTGGTIGTHVD